MIEILLIIAVAISTISVILLKKDARRIEENERLIKELTPQNPISFYESMKLCKLPVITMKVGDEDINFMLDSGSMESMLDQRVLELFKLPYKPHEKTFEIYGTTGTTEHAFSVLIDLEYMNSVYECHFMVKDLSESMDMVKQEYGVRIHGILGAAFLDKHKYVLDFKDMIAYAKK